MILLFRVGCGYDFTDGQKESGGTGEICSGAAFSVLTVVLAVLRADCLGSGDQLINARLGDLQICSDFPDGIPLQFFHLERSRNAGVLRIHHGLDILVLHFCPDLLVHRSAICRFVSSLSQAVPTDDGRLLFVFIGAGCAGDGVWTLDERLPLTGDHAPDAGITA